MMVVIDNIIEHCLAILGFYSKKRAIKNGMTHHGSYYGIPIWLAMQDGGGLHVIGKHIVCDFLVFIFSIIENIFIAIEHMLMLTDVPGGFRFRLGNKISKDRTT